MKSEHSKLKMDVTNLNNIHQYLLLVLPKCGNIMREAFFSFKDKNLITKSSFADFNLDTDKQVEKALISGIKAKYPNHSFIGGESIGKGKVTLTNEPLWVIDPIDGTTNFVHGLPRCSISIAFFLNKEVQIGVVYNPMLDEVYSAIKGQGAYRNGRTIFSSGAKDLQNCLVVTEFGHAKDPEHLQLKANNMLNIIGKTHSIRCFGASALDACAVAAGLCDVYYDYGTRLWDVAASVLIAREAGCMVSDPSGGEFNMLNRRILITATKELVPQITPLLTNITYKTE